MTWKTTQLLALVLLLLRAAPANAAWGLTPESVSLSDPRVQPLLTAMNQVDRAAFGFTPVTANARLALELPSPGGSYDAMLHVYGTNSQTIAFRKNPGGYRWIFEEETFQGPKWRQTPDGVVREELTIQFATEPVNGIPTNQLSIRYAGDDTNLAGHTLTLAEARPILDKWGTATVDPEPPGFVDDGFDGTLLIGLFMLLAFLAAACFALMAGAIVLTFLAIMVAVGIVSTSVLVGLLRRSVSAGLRTLVYLLFGLGGAAGGCLATFVLLLIFKGGLRSPLHWPLGALFGLLSGLLIAWVFNRSWTWIGDKIARRLKPEN